MFNIDYITDKGGYREDNEDRFLVRTAEVDGELTGLFAVCDGVGGLLDGEIAAQIVIDDLDKWWNERYPDVYDDPKVDLQNTIFASDQHLKAYGNANGLKYATTLSALLINQGKGYIFHVGDTKIVKMDPATRKVSEITIPHKKQIEVGGKFYLTECMGNAKKGFHMMASAFRVDPWDRFFVGSDGAFNNELMDKLPKMIEEDDLCKNALEYVRNTGEKDNVTLIYIENKGEGEDPYEEKLYENNSGSIGNMFGSY